MNGPFCPIYGIGVTAVIVLTKPFADSALLLYITSAFLVTLLELMTGTILEKLFHHRWWDYSRKPLNIGGYVCLSFSCIRGVACVIIVKYIHPLIAWMVSRIPFKAGSVILAGLFIALFVDIWITVAAILVLNEKLKDIRAKMEELQKLPEKMKEALRNSMKYGFKKKSVIERLFKAFPNIRSKPYGEELDMLRNTPKEWLENKRENRCKE